MAAAAILKNAVKSINAASGVRNVPNDNLSFYEIQISVKTFLQLAKRKYGDASKHENHKVSRRDDV